MSTVSFSTSTFAQPPFPVRRFTVDEYERMTAAGVLSEADAVELLEGWIVPKMPKYPPHDGTIDLIAALLTSLLPPGYFVRVQNSLRTPDSEPEPDLAVVRGKPGDYRRRHPTGKDTVLVIEVADSTLSRDRMKARIYARAEVPNYWIVNLPELKLEQHSQPKPGDEQAAYQAQKTLAARQEAELKFDDVHELRLPLDEILASLDA